MIAWPAGRWVPTLQQLGRQALRFGLPGAAGLVLLATAGVVALGVLPRGEAEHAKDQVNLQAARLRAMRAMHDAAAAAPAADPAQAFTQAFPDAGSRHRRIQRLVELAAGQGLAARRADLREQPGAVPGLQRLRVSMPMTGEYAQIRRYVELALRDDPALALDQLRLDRADPSARQLRAELQWSLWMRADARPVGSAPGARP